VDRIQHIDFDGFHPVFSPISDGRPWLRRTGGAWRPARPEPRRRWATPSPELSRQSHSVSWRPHRRGMYNIVHILPAGRKSVKESSTTTRKFRTQTEEAASTAKMWFQNAPRACRASKGVENDAAVTGRIHLVPVEGGKGRLGRSCLPIAGQRTIISFSNLGSILWSPCQRWHLARRGGVRDTRVDVPSSSCRGCTVPTPSQFGMVAG
jgi:hypothetical protein